MSLLSESVSGNFDMLTGAAGQSVTYTAASGASGAVALIPVPQDRKRERQDDVEAEVKRRSDVARLSDLTAISASLTTERDTLTIGGVVWTIVGTREEDNAGTIILESEIGAPQRYGLQRRESYG